MKELKPKFISTHSNFRVVMYNLNYTKSMTGVEKKNVVKKMPENQGFDSNVVKELRGILLMKSLKKEVVSVFLLLIILIFVYATFSYVTNSELYNQLYYAKMTESNAVEKNDIFKKIAETYFTALNSNDIATIKSVSLNKSLNPDNIQSIKLLYMGRSKNLEEENTDNLKMFIIVYEIKRDFDKVKKRETRIIDFVKDEDTGEWLIKAIGKA